MENSKEYNKLMESVFLDRTDGSNINNNLSFPENSINNTFSLDKEAEDALEILKKLTGEDEAPKELSPEEQKVQEEKKAERNNWDLKNNTIPIRKTFLKDGEIDLLKFKNKNSFALYWECTGIEGEYDFVSFIDICNAYNILKEALK